MNLQKLDTLKQKLATGPKLDDVFDYFLTNFGDLPAFMDVGGQTHDPLLEQLVGAVAAQLFGPQIKLAGMLQVRIAEHHFIHGACFINGRMANFIYFDDITVGMVAIAPGKKGQATQFSRFTGRKLPEGYVASDN